MGGSGVCSRPEAAGFVEVLLDICGSRDSDYVFYFLHGGSAAVTEPLSQEGSLETFLVEDEADIGGEATGGKLRHTILADFISDKCMSVLRVSASICISHVSLCVGSSTQHRLR